ncbi:hypothetical protein NC651_002692 [Populus alba x Populus x berolinensis]|nr:hypothetical protein NC651_002692 [Populus alba x Populus x berolinensis]
MPLQPDLPLNKPPSKATNSSGQLPEDLPRNQPGIAVELTQKTRPEVFSSQSTFQPKCTRKSILKSTRS